MLNYIAAAAVAGFFLPLQALINARTSGILGGPFMATLVNFAGGTIMLIVLLLAIRAPVPTVEQLGRVPVYGWFTGLAGVMFVAQAAYTVPKLGAAAMISLVIAGQMFASIAFDHFGVLQEPQPVTLQKAAGALLLLAGVYLILRPGN
ncbi:MAG: DMT family transporter [Rhodomicrobium sp.]|nr:DMT family transporter [Rhodomicrobium sp.]